MSIKHELQNIISGNGEVRNGKTIQTIAHYLRRKKAAISEIEKTKFLKEQETEELMRFIEQNSLWLDSLDSSKYIGEGAEQKIFEHPNPNFVIKLNDRIFYACWEDYFHSLLLHNFFFPHLAYELIGFLKESQKLYSVVKQPFVKSTENTNLHNVKVFLETNGFINKKANDYYHPKLGLILEDLHDENVLTEEGTLQFIDTVFFITPEFYEKEN
ncbi:MAG: hypothetical protein ACK452_16490 [Bacteroidota bacterium]|jgi:hypothetical protein